MRFCVPTILVIVLLSIKTTKVSAYSREFSVSRRIRVTSIDDAYRRCLRGWAIDNLGFPWFIPPPLVKLGDEVTGVGLVVTRLPPLALQEGIVDHCYYNETDRTSRTMIYTILNPGWLTWPVSEHIGSITFCQDHNDCLLEWVVRFTPLSLPIFSHTWADLVQWTMVALVNIAANYVARVDGANEKENKSSDASRNP